MTLGIQCDTWPWHTVGCKVNEKPLLLLLAVALKSNRLSQPRAVDFSHIISPWLEANRCLVGWPHSVLPDRWKLFKKNFADTHEYSNSSLFQFKSPYLTSGLQLGTQSVLLFLMGKLHFRAVLGPSKIFMHALLAIQAGTAITKLVCARTVPILQSHPTTGHFPALKHRTPPPDRDWFWRECLLSALTSDHQIRFFHELNFYFCSFLNFPLYSTKKVRNTWRVC